MQGNYTRDFFTAVFAHPRVTGITMWGFWEGTIRTIQTFLCRSA